MGEPLTVGIVGAGKISAAYAETLARLPGVRLTRVADLDLGRAAALAADLPGVLPVPPDELLACADVDAVLNLTVPRAHATVALAALAAGKHVYGEKPLATGTTEAAEVLAAAAAAGRTVACAPDTVLGTGLQTARASLAAGDIGVPVAATAFMVTPGHERWHPSPQFYYEPGGGPLYDMGPYYLTALVHLLGPVRRVTGMASTPRPTRTTLDGVTFPVEVATHVTGVLEHASGALTTLMMSFDAWTGRLPRIEVYGTEGTLNVPDPNGFAGDVHRFAGATREWTKLPDLAGYRDAARGYGVADLARALRTGTQPRASADLAYHVLDVMESLLSAAATGTTTTVTSTCEVPAPVPLAADPDRA
ncbi:Gfo/Idh/MocA family oxidoreductase [Dactylosporangium sp. AC04546]|uniref:Gfo/Idh/MocA family protein n=1 Tax=Dactylosporangium sp. AC04546 TaxID=2862460 RepID=UPI001EDF4FDB|nr:Gfo/Idh/MocA family oxidoreductase [Dactylosporangium sp. AC04546]WVK80162.1 Gfo/Idh/MocA family oxidoreductase [Dactylosporangium sp. AC04546]